MEVIFTKKTKARKLSPHENFKVYSIDFHLKNYVKYEFSISYASKVMPMIISFVQNAFF